MLKTDECGRAPTCHLSPSSLIPSLSFQGLSRPRQLLASGVGVGRKDRIKYGCLSLGQGLSLAVVGGVSVTLGCHLEEYASGIGLLGVLASGTASIGVDGQPRQVGAGWSPPTALPTCHPPARVTGCLTQ